MRTPSLINFDDSRQLFTVPYLVYERVHGDTLESHDLDPDQVSRTWRHVGRDLALLHSGVTTDDVVTELQPEPIDDPRLSAEAAVEAGQITAVEARWLIQWLDRLEPEASAPVVKRFCHGDLQATNVMVDPTSLAYLALIDWGCANWGDPANDLAGFPLRAVPHVLAGHREVAPLESDGSAEVRILWRHLTLALWLLRRSPQPNRSWAERPAAMLIDIVRFFLGDPGAPWDAFAPPDSRLRSTSPR